MHWQRKYYPLYFHRLLVTSLYIFFIVLDGKAQYSNQIFEHLTNGQGLSSDKVEAVLQDHEGFYWVATQNGLNRYDGTSFKAYRHDANDSTSLTHNYCTTLVEDKNGDIWVATFKGVSRFIKRKGCFQQIYLNNPSKNFEITNRIYALAVDGNGNIWIAGNGLWRYNTKNDSVYFFQNNTIGPSPVSEKSIVLQLVYDKINNGVWLAPGNELAFYGISKNQFYFKNHNPLQWKVFDVANAAVLAMDNKNRLWFQNNMTYAINYFEIDKNQITITDKIISDEIRPINVDEKNRLWIFHVNGNAEIYDPVSGATDTDLFTHYHSRSMLSEKATSLFIDAKHNYWIGSENGISIYNEGNQYYKLHQLLVNGTESEENPIKINALAQNEPAHIWLATNQGLYTYDLVAGNYLRIHINDLQSNINTLCADGDLLWIGMADHLICLDTKKDIIVKNIRLMPGIFFIRKGNKNDLWIGFWTNGLCRINEITNEIKYFQKNDLDPSSIHSNSLVSGYADGDNFWVGYNAGLGFSAYSISFDTFRHFQPLEKELSNSGAGTITVMTKDPAEKIWLGTYGSGVFRFDPVSNTYENFQQPQGLNSNYINSIVPDVKGNLWISTADGLDYFSSEKRSIHSLDAGLVFPDNELQANGIHGVNDRLYFFCKNEFIEVDPMAYHPDTSFPQLVITNFKIFDKDVPVSTKEHSINLSYRQNFFSFEYSIIKTNPLKEANYAFRLEGFDKAWNMAGHQQYASYTNVPDGKYTFEVKTTNDEGEWSNELLSLDLHIEPPFWRTWWFIALCVAAITCGVYSLYRYRIGQIKKIFSLRTKISQDLHDDIGGSLSSIHIYSSVAEKEVTDNPDKAIEFLQQINTNSKQVMENISDIVWANRTDDKHATTLEGRIKNYGYDLLSQKNIECTYMIDALAERKMSKPEARRSILLIIKEALNNMAKYSEATHAEIRVSVDGPQLRIDISDNGRGFNTTTDRAGNGLLHMKQRTELLGGSFVLSSISGQGTSMHCRIPITNISDR